jgi:IS5 family transposase
MLKTDPHQTEFVDFYLPFNGHLSASNRWVKLAALVPWDEVERCYRESFAGTGMGAPAKSGRLAYGALLIKERLGITDEETLEQIYENPYLQYFLGFKELCDKAPFDSSMMVHFRSRFTAEHHELINTKIIAAATGIEDREDQSDIDEDDNEGNASPNAGKLLVDATCTPADIRYPTDLSLLNEAREKAEAVIDQFHGHIVHTRGKPVKKPRTYRQNARKRYLVVAKQKKPGAKKIRKAIGQQLNYLKRNLGHIAVMVDSHPGMLGSLDRYDYKCLLVIHTLYEQQRQMHELRTHSVPDRIVSISQPHVRPIVRGKAGKRVEFGAKISISHQKDGYVSLDTLSWDAYNERQRFTRADRTLQTALRLLSVQRPRRYDLP